MAAKESLHSIVPQLVHASGCGGNFEAESVAIAGRRGSNLAHDNWDLLDLEYDPSFYCRLLSVTAQLVFMAVQFILLRSM